MFFNKIILLYKQYGIKGFLIRILKFVLRKIGVIYESYYYLIQNIDIEKSKKYWEKNKIENVKILIYEDFLTGDKDIFNHKKLDLIKIRLETANYIPYGVSVEGKLIYSCWLSLKEFSVLSNFINLNLPLDSVLFIDDYCSPSMRGKGIHTSMNNYRLIKAFEMGYKKAIVLILKENYPALKSQLKSGFQIFFSFYILKIGRFHFSNLHPMIFCA